MPSVVTIGGPNMGATFDLGPHEMVRLTRAGKALAPGIPASDVQAELRAQNGAFFVVPAKGLAVRVNGKAVEGGRKLAHGDVIELAETAVLYSDEGLGATAAPTTVHRQRYFDSAQTMSDSLKGTRDAQKILGSLLKVTHALFDSVNLDALLPKLLDIVFEVVPGERGTLMLIDPFTGELAAAATRRSPYDSDPAVLHGSRTIVKHVLETKMGVLTRDARHDRRFDASQSLDESAIQTALCVPLVGRSGDVLGAIYLDARSLGRAFTEDELKLLTGIAMEASLAIENARLVRAVEEKKLIEQELKIASDIQTRLVPQKAPSIPGLDIAGRMVPAREVGGDYFDFVSSDDGGRFYVTIGDVSGHGVPAGLVMVMARCFLRSIVRRGGPTREVVDELHRLLLQNMQRNMFMSFLALAYRPGERTIEWTGAGHEHLLIFRAATGRVERLRAGGMALGLPSRGDPGFTQNALALDAGDVVLLYTDGATEAMNVTGDAMGLDALAESLGLHGRGDAATVLAKVMDDVRGFIGKAEPHDDLTLVVLKRV